MKPVSATTALLASAAFAFVSFTAVGMAEAKTNFMAECSAKYKAAKSDGSIDASTKWTDFMKTQCAGQNTGAASAPAQATQAKSASTARTRAPKAASATAKNGNFMQQCSAKWQQMKQAGTIPAGLKWTSFVKQNCELPAAAVSTQDNADSSVPAEPNDGKYSNYQSIDVASHDKNGKPFTPGQIAAHKRIKECAIEWHDAKQNGSLPSGEKWPQYWSQCNSRLKSQG